VKTCRVDGKQVAITVTPGGSEQEADKRAEIDSRISTSFSKRVLPLVQEITRVDESARWAPVIGSMCANIMYDPFRIIFRDSTGKMTQELRLVLAGDACPAEDLWAEVSLKADDEGRHIVEFRRKNSEYGELESTEQDLPATLAAFVQAERAAGRLPSNTGARVILHVDAGITAKEAARHIRMMQIPEVIGITWYFDEEEENGVPGTGAARRNNVSPKREISAPAHNSPGRTPESTPPPR
jgi:hypothetical protein